MEYENDSLSIRFNIQPTAVDFTLRNKLNDGIKINWDEVSLSLGGNAKRIIHKETGLTKITDLQPPTTIPPKSMLTDIVVPSSKVSFKKLYGSYYPEITAMYPVAVTKKDLKNALSRKGESIVLFMPLRIADKYVSQTFYFTVVDIFKTKKSSPKKVVWK